MLVDRVKLSTTDRVQENLSGFLDAFEEGIVFGAASGCLLVGMVAEDLFTVGTLDLVFRSTVAVFGKTKDSVMILTLDKRMQLVFT